MEGEVLFRTSLEVCTTFAGRLQILPWLGFVSSGFCWETPTSGESWTLTVNFKPRRRETGPDFARSYAGQVKCPEVGLGGGGRGWIGRKTRKSRKREVIGRCTWLLRANQKR